MSAAAHARGAQRARSQRTEIKSKMTPKQNKKRRNKDVNADERAIKKAIANRLNKTRDVKETKFEGEVTIIHMYFFRIFF
jgi:hypothetical protein